MQAVTMLGFIGRFAVGRLDGQIHLGFLVRYLLLAFALTCLSADAAQRRVALVVGNATYAEKPLRNPVNDAELMQRTLSELGFEVSLLRNADRRSLLAGLRDFEERARNSDVALFFFAGHGAQVAGTNFLIPLNTQIRAESDVPDEAVDATSVLRRIEGSQSKVGLVILDACRDNPYMGTGRSGSRGLARMSVPTGSIVAYATAPGDTADDGRGANGIYTEQLVRHLSLGGLDIREVFDRTAMEVERITGGRQRPREDVGLRGRVVLKDAVGTIQDGAQLGSKVPTATPGQTTSLSLEDLEKEESIRQQWSQWQTRMKADFDRTAGFNGSADLKVLAWERFLAAWLQDNPLSTEDEKLRTQGASLLLAAKQQAARAKIQSDQAATLALPNKTSVPVSSYGQQQSSVQSFAPMSRSIGEMCNSNSDCYGSNWCPQGVCTPQDDVASSSNASPWPSIRQTTFSPLSRMVGESCNSNSDCYGAANCQGSVCRAQ